MPPVVLKPLAFNHIVGDAYGFLNALFASGGRKTLVREIP
jgi:hypothetical protein